MKLLALALILAPIFASANPVSSNTKPLVVAYGEMNCGIRPIANIGCRIGRCVDGAWEQVCDSNPGISCGIKPIPNIGCRIGRCVGSEWEQVCDSNPGISCGIKPIPNIGCRIGRCVGSEWEQVCN